MKSFFSSFLGSFTALVLFVFGGGFLLFLGVLVVASFSEQPQATVKSGSYLVFDLSTNITDAPAQLEAGALMAAFTGGDIPNQLQTRLVTRALHEAAADDRIEGMLIKGSFAPQGYGTSFAALQEVRRALEVFKKSGKPIHAYLQYADTRDFYIASVADDLALDPNGMVFMPGLASEGMFFKGLFDKFGIGVQAVKVGEFKSAVEPYTRTDFSPENRVQLESLLGELWGEMRDTVAEARQMNGQAFQALIDSGKSYIAEDLVTANLVDRLVYTDEVLQDLKEKTGVSDPKTPFKQVNLPAYISQIPKVSAAPEETPQDLGSSKGRVAVVYAEGVIVDGSGTPTSVGGSKFAREIRRLRQDPAVKAIVVRVNSPGGSATASEHILRELRLAKETLPVVVSMGGYAASGGYWISTHASRIFAEPLTVTGSIGVYGYAFNIAELSNDFGITWDRVKTGKYADTLSISRPKTEDEIALMERMTNKIYEDFIQRTAEGRAMEPAAVRDIAEGRVWTGSQALELGLVDELGGLADAIAYAAQSAELAKGFRVSEFPAKKELAEVIAEALEQFQPSATKAGWLNKVSQEASKVVSELEQFNDPRGVYARMPFDLLIK